MANALAPVVGPKISKSHRKRTPEQCAEIGRKAQETFKRNHPNITRSDISKQIYINNPEIGKRNGERHSQ